MIKLIVLDVDGVVKGFKEGVNSPYPSQKVTDYVRTTQDKGIPICLCTGKASFAVRKIVEKMGLNNQHITDGGAVVFDPLDDTVLKSITLPQEVAKTLLHQGQGKKILWELYTLKNKFIEDDFPLHIIENPHIMPYQKVTDLRPLAETEKMTKIEIKYLPNTEKYLKQIFEPHKEKIDIQWTHIPSLLPMKIVILTAKGVSKHVAVVDLVKFYGVDFSEVLAVGDTMMDWGFMDGCGYVATMGNANGEMKELILDHGGFVGGHVDDDGLIDILEHYRKDIIFTSKT